jgi:hypothetical protein
VVKQSWEPLVVSAPQMHEVGDAISLALVGQFAEVAEQ